MDSSQWNDNAGSFAVDVRPWSATPSIQPPGLVQISTAFANPTAADYYEPNNTLIASVNYSSGQPRNFVEIKPDGSQVPFSNVAGFTDEVYMAMARSSDLGGFTPGDLFVGNGVDGQIARITDHGATVINPWVVLPGFGHGLFRGGLQFDRTGVFGGDLIAETHIGELWRINAAGQATKIGSTGTFLEGLEIIPADTARYGPLAGKILATNEQSGNLYTIDPAGQVQVFNIGIGGLEDAHVITPNENFIGVDFGSGHVYGIRAADLAPLVGDIILPQEFGGGLYRLYWDGMALQTQLIQLAAGSPRGFGWEGTRFAPAGVNPLPPVPLEPGLAGWTIYLDLDHNGKRDTGEPFTTTDALGHYAFTGLTPGTYTLAEEGQPGWRQTVPGGQTWTVTVTAGHVRSGIDFGNTQKDVPTDQRPPRITSTPPTAATVEEPFRYDATVSNPDGRPLTFDLPVHPAGMAVDAATGTVVWSPTASQLGPQRVLLRVTDDRGLVDIQDFTVQVLAIDTAPIIASTPPAPALAGFPYQYQVHAQDAEGETITFTLGTHPDGMAINAATGLLTWTPDASLAGTTQHVVVIAADPRGMISQTFDLDVTAPGTNQFPSITSTPRLTIGLGHGYAYQVQASDPDHDPLSYHLDVFPTGMTVGASGLIRWTPGALQFGPNPVRLRVADGRGGEATQDFTVTVVSHDTNRPPVITSRPLVGATVGRLYAYDVRAADPDGDPVFFSLDQAPAGLSIDPATGTIRWLPQASQLGPNDVAVRVIDVLGASTTQSFTVIVRSVNVPPVITSTPPTQAATGQAYAYAVAASDTEGDPLTFTLLTPPQAMTIDAATGLIRWTPQAAQLGDNTVTVQVDDGQGGTAQQSYTIVVSDTPLNPPPVITSTPPLTATAGMAYQYQVQANDPDGEPLVYALRNPSGDMQIDSTGLLTWNPGLAEVGSVAVGITVSEASGGAASQDFTVTVARANHAPVISSQPPLTLSAGLVYRYDVRATDADGDPLSYVLAGIPPAGMTIDSLGRLTWATGAADVGDHPVAVAVSDGHGETVTQPFTLKVLADTEAPKVKLIINPATSNVGDTVTFVVSATDNVGVQNLDLTVGTTHVALDANGRGSMVFPNAGLFDVTATAMDAAGNAGTSSIQLTVFDPTVTGAPTVALTTPADGDVISAPTDVIGTASDPNLLFYTLEVSPVGSDVFTEIFRGTSSVVNGVLGKFDPSLLQNDSYVLRLTATNAGGISASTEETVSVMGNLKLGNFTLSFEDLSIPVSGIPITVGRTYDTLNAARNEDFGFGWRLEFRDVNLRTSVGPSGLEDVGIHTAFRDGTRVYITLPGGKREGFTFRPTAQQFLFQTFYHPNFVPDAGVTSRLNVADTTLDTDGFEYFSFGEGLPYNPAGEEFGGRYTLTTKEGMVYAIDASNGRLISVTDTNGNRVTFSDGGVESSTGTKVAFERDPQGRIVAVTDPLNHQVRYQYDANSDLVAVTDREGNTTRFVYRTDRPHYLDKVIDPLGRTGVRTDYDARGRLVSMIDATGKTVNLVHDPSHSLETVQDQLGNPTTFEYDERGNVVRQIDALGGITSRTYDADNNMLTETDPLNHTRTFTYDNAGNVLTETDPLGNVTRHTYGPFGRLLSTTDPLGNTTSNSYDSRGNLLSTTDDLGNVTNYSYDSAGNPTSITDPSGKVTRLEYDGAGRVTRRIDPLGGVTSYTFDANGNQLTQTTTLTTPGGVRTLVTRNEYDDQGRVIKTTDAEGGITQTIYDALGNRIAAIDALGRTTRFRYDERGQLVETIYPDATPNDDSDNPRTQTEYDAAGRVTARIDELGRRIESSYDPLGRLVETIYPDATPQNLNDNPRTKIGYNTAGQVIVAIDERGNPTEFAYDAAGHRTVVRDVLGKESTSTYDAAGRLIAQTDALGHTTRFILDALGRTTQTIFVDGTSTSTTYDQNGRAFAQTDQAGRTTNYEFDALGELTAVILPAVIDPATGNLTRPRYEYRYDEAGNQVSQKDPLGHITRYEYDGLNRRIATVLPLGQRSTTAYDRVGNVAATTDFNGDTIVFRYDERNQLIRKDYPDGTFVTFTYTLTGQRATSTDARGVTRWTYDERDELLSRIDPDGSAISYTYDAAGNRTSVAIPSGTTHYAFDALNRLETVTDPDGGLTRYFYNDVSNLVRTEFPNTTVETRQYDDLNHLVFLENSGPGGVISSYRYTLNSTGRRDAVVEDTGRRVDYSYDALDRLTRENIIDAVVGNRTVDYTYDLVGNRLARNDTAEGLTNYTYDSNDRLLTDSLVGIITVYSYDNNGNTLSKVTSPTDQASYSWDFQNRLIAAVVTDATGTHHLSYQYDASGIRVSSTTDGADIRYQIDANRPYAEVLVEYTPSGVITASYVYGNTLISQKRGAAVAYYAVDGLGSTRTLTNTTGVVSDRYIYDAFGRILLQVGNTANAYLFAGQERDVNLGLDYLRARYLDLGIGRFLSMDRLPRNSESPRAFHAYIYASGNPINRWDPSGRWDLPTVTTTQAIIITLTVVMVGFGVPLNANLFLGAAPALARARRWAASMYSASFSGDPYHEAYATFQQHLFVGRNGKLSRDLENRLRDNWLAISTADPFLAIAPHLALIQWASSGRLTIPAQTPISNIIINPYKFLTLPEYGTGESKTLVMLHELAHYALGLGGGLLSPETYDYDKCTELADESQELALNNAQNYAWAASSVFGNTSSRIGPITFLKR